jgi:hypothetical protein
MSDPGANRSSGGLQGDGGVPMPVSPTRAAEAPQQAAEVHGFAAGGGLETQHHQVSTPPQVPWLSTGHDLHSRYC